MNEEEQESAVRRELIERLRAMEGSQTPSSMAERAYKDAREALEKASAESRAIRLQAIEDARLTREREMNALLESLRSLRQSAEAQVESVLLTARIEAERIADQAKIDARVVIEAASTEAEHIKDEARAIRTGAEQQASESKRIETEFNELLTEVASRLGIIERPARGWFRRSASRP